MEPLAHSARPSRGVPAQPYRVHVVSVRAGAEGNARAAASCSPQGGDAFVDAVQAAAEVHDLGKLDEANQAVLRSSPDEKLPINHVDAGAALLLGSLKRQESALLVHAHHAGMCSVLAECSKGDQFLRDPKARAATDTGMPCYLAAHERAVGPPPCPIDPQSSSWTGLTRRLALSCLVDADHGDTARNYGQETTRDPLPTRWQDRLRSLDAFAQALFERDPASPRSQLRRDLYRACRDSATDPPMRACDSPVGTGKTTAVMGHLIHVAAVKGLRHIFVVLPFTNIIKQSVEVYRSALTLTGEAPEQVVAEHHHQADFESLEDRQLATLWNAPVTVTTAVQFFETIASNQPSRLRKLHQLPASGIFIDETHAALPSWFWPQAWLWLKELVDHWGCHVVFASGTLARFWRLPQFVSPPAEVPELAPAEIRARAKETELSRTTAKVRDDPLTRQELLKFVLSKPGPRLVIMNTVQSAAVIAEELRRSCNRVLHLSTALCPAHREIIAKRVTGLLGYPENHDWTLVATSCVEAGLDFSFRTGFRESCSMASLIQTGGRVNRHGKHDEAEVWDFRVLDPLLNRHPSFETSRHVLDGLFRDGMVNRSPDEAATEAMRREVMSDASNTAASVMEREKRMDYPAVAELCRVIQADTRLVVIDKGVEDALKRGRAVSSQELVRSSVQLWSDKIKKLALCPIPGHPDIFAWGGVYDPDLLGYMAGVLPMVYATEEGLVY